MAHRSAQYISSQFLWWILLFLVCAACSVTVIFVKPVFVVALLLVLLNTFLILKYPMYGLLVYLSLFLLRPGELYPSLQALRPELLVGGFSLLAVILNQKFTTGKVVWPTDRITLAMLGLLLAMTLSIFTSYEMSQTRVTVIDFVKIIIFYYLIVCNLTTRKRFVTFMTVFVFLIIYIAFDALKNYMSGEFIHTMDVDRLTGSTSAGGDPNTLASTMAATIPLIVAMMFYFKRVLQKLAMLGLGFVMAALIVITASRGGLLSFMGTVFAAISYSKQKYLLTIGTVVLIFGAWTVLPDQYKARYERFEEVATDLNKGSSGRWEIWQAGMHMVAARPLLGIGAGAFAWAYRSGDFGPPQWMDPHNLYIQVFATTGIVGASVWITFLVFYIRTLRRLARETRGDPEYQWMSIFANGIFISLIALFVSGMFGHTFMRYTWYMMAGLAAAMNAMWETRPQTDIIDERSDHDSQAVTSARA